ncbi:hypothetical protein HOF92_16605, partial [bacterium]|nr:hypothetical protein [bacterium]
INQSDSVRWSSEEDKKLLKKALDTHDLFVLGRVTYEVSKEMMSDKRCLVFTKSNLRSENDNLIYFNPDTSDIEQVLKECEATNIALFGGAQVYRYALLNNLVKEISLTVEPLILGGGISFLGEGEPWKALENFRLKSCKKLNDQGTLHLVYELN